jgi:hypothetical protein
MIKSSNVAEIINSHLGDYSRFWNYLLLTSKISKELHGDIYENLFLDIYNELDDFYEETYPQNIIRTTDNI